MDARTAEITELPYDALKKIVKRITAEVSGVTKVVYDTAPKPLQRLSMSKKGCITIFLRFVNSRTF